MKKDKIILDSYEKRFAIKIGFGGSEGVCPNNKGYVILGESGKIHFKGKAVFCEGISIRVDSGILEIGDSFYCNRNCFISCSESISFGSKCLLGWNVNIRDSDGHTIMQNHIVKEEKRPVIIKDHVWISAYVDILKGVTISEYSVIGYRSCVTKKFETQHCLIAGYPASVIQTDVNWVE